VWLESRRHAQNQLARRSCTHRLQYHWRGQEPCEFRPQEFMGLSVGPLGHFERGDPSRARAFGWVKTYKNPVQRADPSLKRMAATSWTTQTRPKSGPRLHGRGHRGLAARILPWPASHTSPPAPPPHQDRRFGSAVDAGHRRRDADKRCGSIGRNPALSRCAFAAS
jgi:hypothetical protein